MRTREEILSKEVLRIADIMELFGIEYTLASRKIREIRAHHDRLKLPGVCHIQDYYDYYEIPIECRFKHIDR